MSTRAVLCFDDLGTGTGMRLLRGEIFPRAEANVYLPGRRMHRDPWTICVLVRLATVSAQRVVWMLVHGVFFPLLVDVVGAFGSVSNKRLAT